VQTVFVVRGDAMAKYEINYGPSSDFPGIPPLILNPGIPSDSVASLQDWADRHREDQRWAKREEEWKAESTLIRDVLDQHDEVMEVIRNRSVIGPAITKQRIDYPAEAVSRRFFEQRDANAGYSRNLRKRTR
jgi:hypothetical protein